MLVEFASVVDAVRCAIAVQRATAAREAACVQERRIEFRIGIIWATLSSRATISSATASTSPRDSKPSQRRTGQSGARKSSHAARRAQPLSFTIATIAFLLIVLAGVVALPIILNYLPLPGVTGLLLESARWPILLVLVAFGLTLIYRYGPSRTEPSCLQRASTFEARFLRQ
jgi:hypothetical protein